MPTPCRRSRDSPAHRADDATTRTKSPQRTTNRASPAAILTPNRVRRANRSPRAINAASNPATTPHIKPPRNSPQWTRCRLVARRRHAHPGAAAPGVHNSRPTKPHRHHDTQPGPPHPQSTADNRPNPHRRHDTQPRPPHPESTTACQPNPPPPRNPTRITPPGTHNGPTHGSVCRGGRPGVEARSPQQTANRSPRRHHDAQAGSQHPGPTMDRRAAPSVVAGARVEAGWAGLSRERRRDWAKRLCGCSLIPGREAALARSRVSVRTLRARRHALRSSGSLVR